MSETPKFRNLPRYRCHKQVQAVKIARVEHHQPVFQNAVCKGSFALGSACGRCERCQFMRESGGGTVVIITPADPGVAPFSVEPDYVRKHNPQPGGYFVVYEDGYQSFSPAQAFEAGYTRIEQ